VSLLKELNRRNVTRVAVAYVVASWVVTEALQLASDVFGAPDWVMKMLVTLIVIGFVPVMIFSWIYELTPDGVRREKDITPDESITAHTAKKLDMAVIALLVVAIGLFAYDRYSGPAMVAAPTDSERMAAVDADGRASIAVLPFVNMSGNPENEYFSDGLTETLLHMLAQVSELRVAARTSAFAFKGTNTDIREIATQLNVTTVLEGSVQRAGQRVRITAQLIDARDGSHIWSENYDRELDDIFGIQDEIANAVARALTDSLVGAQVTDAPSRSAPAIASLSTHDAVAYDHYLRGLAPLAIDSYGSLPEAERAFRNALLADPAFKEARLALVETYLAMADTGLITDAEANRKSRDILAPLLAGGSNDPLVGAYDAFVAFQQAEATTLMSEADRDDYFTRLATYIVRAPNNPQLYSMASDVLRFTQRRAEERLAFMDRALELDPLSPTLQFDRGVLLAFSLQREDEALAAFARVRELEPNNPNAYAFAGFIYRGRGEYAETARWMARAAAVDPQDHELVAFMATALQDMGLTEQAERWIARAELLNADGGATQVARLWQHYLTGDHEVALDMAERILRAKVDDRRNRYRDAAFIYSTLMRERGRSADVLALYEALAPGSTSGPGYAAQDPLQRVLNHSANGLQFQSLSPEQQASWREAFATSFDEAANDWRTSDDWALTRYAFGFSTADEAAPGFARDLGSFLEFTQRDRITYAQPRLSELIAQPEVAAALVEQEAHNAEQAELYLAMVARGEIPGA